MARKKTKSVSFDAMVKYFMQTYGIPTKRDIDKIMTRLDRLESLIKSGSVSRDPKPAAAKAKIDSQGKRKNSGMTASDIVLGIITRSKNGAGFADIQKKAGFPEKKLRNIIFRLSKLGKIKPKGRGIYLAV